MSNTFTPTQQALIDAEVQRRVAEAMAKKAPSTSIKLQEKGTVSVYGLGRFPVSLYLSQWTRLIAMVKDIEAFLAKPEVVAASERAAQRHAQAKTQTKPSASV